jgi:putative endonuclease
MTANEPTSGTPASPPWAVYLLHCVGGKSYIGISPTPQERFATHLSGKGAVFTRANPPQSLAAIVWFENRSAAASMEARLKLLPRPAKLAWFGHAAGWSAAGPATLQDGLESLTDSKADRNTAPPPRPG